MRKNKKLMLGILIIVLITIICVLIAIKVDNKNIIQKQVKEAEKLAEANQDNSYITTAEHLAEVNASVAKLTEFKSAIANYISEAGGVKPETTSDTRTFGERIKGIVKEVTKNATATAEDIVEGKTAWVNGEQIIGTCSSTSQEFEYTYLGYLQNPGGEYTVTRTGTYQNDNYIAIVSSISSTFPNSFGNTTSVFLKINNVWIGSGSHNSNQSRHLLKNIVDNADNTITITSSTWNNTGSNLYLWGLKLK